MTPCILVVDMSSPLGLNYSYVAYLALHAHIAEYIFSTSDGFRDHTSELDPLLVLRHAIFFLQHSS